MRGRKVARLAHLLCAVAAGIFLCACSSEDVSSLPASSIQEENGDDAVPTIGLLFDSFIIDRWETDRDIFVSTAKDLGANVIVASANGDVKEQVTLMDRMIDSKVDVIVVIAVDGTELVDSVEKAHREDIKVISYDRLIENAGTDLYITFDNEKVGEYMAEIINETAPENGSYIKLRGSDTDPNVEMVDVGFERVIREDLSSVGEMYCKEWNDEQAYDYLIEHVGMLRNVDAIMCGNDAVAGQAVRVLSENRLAGKVIVTGQDADLEACQHIVEGTQSMTVYKPIDQIAREAATAAVHMAKGEDVGAIETIHDGSRTIPYMELDPILVTKDNMDETVVSGGFHLKEEIYLHSAQE